MTILALNLFSGAFNDSLGKHQFRYRNQCKGKARCFKMNIYRPYTTQDKGKANNLYVF